MTCKSRACPYLERSISRPSLGRRTILCQPDLFHIFQSAAHSNQQGVRQGQRGHRFYYYHRSGHNHRIVAAVNLNGGGFPLPGHGLLRRSNRRSGLDGGPQHNITAVADAAQDASGVVREGGNASVFRQPEKASLFSRPVADAARNPSPISTPFTAPMDMTGFRQVGVQLFEHRITRPRRACRAPRIR